MNSTISVVLDWFSNNPSMVPAIGLTVASLAFVVGRRILVARAAPAADQMPALDARFLQGLNRDRRSAMRREGNAVEVQLTIGSEAPFRGWVMDRATGGLGILVDQSIATGTNMRVRPRNASSAPWTDIVVRSCKDEGGQFVLGCQFHRPPNYNLLLMFG